MIPIKNINKLEISKLIKKYKNSAKEIAAKFYKTNVKLITNNSLFYNFWDLNWFKSNNNPKIKIYAIKSDDKPNVYYCKEENTMIIFNANYYGHIKSIALELSRDILEDQNILSIHGSSVEIKKRGISIIGKSGAGKSSFAEKLVEDEDATILSDDWIYLDLENNQIYGHNPENYLYMRTRFLQNREELEEKIRRGPLENIERDAPLASFYTKKPRTIIDPKLVYNKIKRESKIDTLFIIDKRRSDSVLIRKVNEFEAIEVLKRNKFFYPNLIEKKNYKKTTELFMKYADYLNIYTINLIKHFDVYMPTIREIIEEPREDHSLII